MSVEINGIEPAQIAGMTGGARSFPACPPPEVSAAIATASATYERLATFGRFVEFGTDSSGALSIALRGEDGSSQTLAPSEALRLAGGEGTGGQV